VSILAIGWEPELRGILTVIIAVFALMGSVYLILGTNIGARLGFLVAFAGLAGWMFLMGAIWWAYGIGLKGPEPSWEAMPGRTVLQNTEALQQAGVLEGTLQFPPGSTYTDQSAPSFGQAGSAASVFLEESKAFAAGEFKIMNVFAIGGERYPNFADGALDFLAFRHAPHYSLVEVAPLELQRTEPGRAPAPPRIDETRQHQYVYMIRDLGAKRQPAGLITIGSLIIFLISCWLLHRRDKRVMINRGQLALPAKA
jgi:hypothetical protein